MQRFTRLYTKKDATRFKAKILLEEIAKAMEVIEIEKEARNTGFQTMRYDGLKKVLRGLTTIDEIEKVTIRKLDFGCNQDNR